MVPDKIGKFDVVEKIGEGGMGVVYKAYDPLMHRNVAIKTFTAELDVEPEVRARFLREAIAVGRLTHANIVTVHDVFDDGNRTYMVMEYLEGMSLGRAMRSDLLRTLEDKLWVMEEVCKGLTFAHSMGIVHRDIKPANVFLTHRNEVRILDFGIARIASTTVSKSATKIMGTPYYMSPEQWSGGQVDHRADIFSFGVMLYELLAGRKPFDSHNAQAVAYQVINTEPTPIRELDTTIPDELAYVVSRSMAKKPEDRFPHVQEIYDELLTVTETLSDPSLTFPETESLSSVPSARGDARTPPSFGRPSTRPRARSRSRSGSRPRSRPQTVPGERGRTWLWAALTSMIAVAATALYFLTSAPEPSPITESVTTSLPAITTSIEARANPSPPDPVPPPVATPSTTSTPTTTLRASTTAIPTTGTLVVESTPGARIVVDGRDRGIAPARLTLEPGAHRVRLTTDAMSWEDVVTVERGTTTTLKRRLDGVGTLAVNSEIWAMIQLDGGEAHETPHFFQNVPAGTHTLRVSRDGYREQRIEITVQPGENRQLTLAMRPAR